MNETVTHPRGGTSLTRLALGGLIGAAGGLALVLAIGPDALSRADAGGLLTLIAGTAYLLMGLLVAFGVAAPAAGAHLLNVEDSDEVREQRPSLGPAAVACVAGGLAMLALAVSPALLTPDVALPVAAAGFIVAGLAGFRSAATKDELIRQVDLEASALTLRVGLIVLGVWAALAHTGQVGWVEPLALLGGAALLHLGVVFWACARRGLLKPRA